MEKPYDWVYWVGEYMEWSKSNFGQALPPVIDSSVFKCVSSFSHDSKYGQIAMKGLFEAEFVYCRDLLAGLKSSGVQGSIAEFGVYQGAWINRLYDMTEAMGWYPEIWGFDSFQGLSDPDPEFDSSFWKKGQFSASIDEVTKNVRALERPRIKLIPGWFSDSLQSRAVDNLSLVSFARIDCDIYRPCLECLGFLGPRLAHGSILVFDDWTHDIRIGEAKAFADWVKEVPELSFEFLFYTGWDHLYLRVWHRDKPRLRTC